MAYNHQAFLQNNKIKASKLPQALQDSIKEFAKLKVDLEDLQDDEADPEEIIAHKQKIIQADQELLAEIKEWYDDELTEDEPTPEQVQEQAREAALDIMYASGIRITNKDALKRANFPHNSYRFDELSCGKYLLRKHRTLTFEYKIILK